MELKKLLVLFKTHLDIGFTDFSANVVAVVFVVSIILNLILPKDMEVEKI